MKKLTVLACICLSFSLLQIINAQEDQESTFDKIWDNVVLYENDENSLMSKFWLTGILSSFLDNAPTYLVFFNTAGGDPKVLMNDIPMTLLAISAGAVFMGANTYIGNAPNFMVKSISESSGISMPSFFGYFFKSTF